MPVLRLSKEDVAAVLSRDRLGPLSGRPLPPRRTLAVELELIRKRGYAELDDAADPSSEKSFTCEN